MKAIIFEIPSQKTLRSYRRRQAVTKQVVFQKFNPPKLVNYDETDDVEELANKLVEFSTPKVDPDATLMLECLQALKKHCLPCEPTEFQHVPFLWRVKKYKNRESFSVDFRYFWSLFWLLIDCQLGRKCPECQALVSCILCLKEIEGVNKCSGCLNHQAICCPGKPMKGDEPVFFACQGCRSTFCYTDIMLSLYGVIQSIQADVDLRLPLSNKILQELSRVMQIDLTFCPIAGPFIRLEKINANFIDYLEMVLKEIPTKEHSLKFLQIF